MRNRAKVPIELQSWLQAEPDTLARGWSKVIAPIARLSQLVWDHIQAGQRTYAVVRALRADQRRRDRSA